MNRMAKRTYLSRDERKQQVIAVVARLSKGGPSLLSSAQIARHMGIKNSTYLREILYDLVCEKVLEMHLEPGKSKAVPHKHKYAIYGTMQPLPGFPAHE